MALSKTVSTSFEINAVPRKPTIDGLIITSSSSQIGGPPGKTGIGLKKGDVVDITLSGRVAMTSWSEEKRDYVFSHYKIVPLRDLSVYYEDGPMLAAQTVSERVRIIEDTSNGTVRVIGGTPLPGKSTFGTLKIEANGRLFKMPVNLQ
ncbi:hypothetical protein D3C87_1718260 [compost metagenome]